MIKYLRYILFYVFLYINGIRFFKTETVPTTAAFKKAEFLTVDGKEVSFLFYKETCEDIILKRNKIKKEQINCYIVHTVLEEDFPEEIKKYNNIKIMFNSKNILIKNEEDLCTAFLNIYLDFMKHEINKK